MTRASVRRRGVERGAAAVEFALILPLLILLIGGIIDFGRAYFTQIELTNAAREGARAAVVSTASTADIEARANAAGVAGMTTTVDTACPGDNAKVTTSVDFTWTILGPALSLFNVNLSDNPLTSTAVMKCGG